MNKQRFVNLITAISFFFLHGLIVINLYFFMEVVKREKSIISELGGPVHLPTQICIQISHLVSHWFIVILLVYFLLFIGCLIISLVCKNKEFLTKIFSLISFFLLIFLLSSAWAIQLPKAEARKVGRRYMSEQEIEIKLQGIEKRAQEHYFNQRAGGSDVIF